MLVNIICSSILQHIYVIYMGRKLAARERSPFLKIGAMLACDQDIGSLHVSSDFWKIICRAGANSLAASWIILAGISPGPVALFGFRLCNSLATPSVVMMM